MIKKAAIVIVVLLVLFCGLGSFVMRAMSQAKASTDTAPTGKAQRGDLVVTVVATGTIDANKTVEVKSQVSGRLAKLLVEEGDLVKEGVLIAVIDPLETQLRVKQDEANFRGAQSVIARSAVEIKQRKLSVKAAYDQALSRVKQLEIESNAQPTLTKASIAEAETALNTALQQREQLVASTLPNLRTTADSALHEAQANYDNALREYQRQSQLGTKGYIPGKDVDTAKLTLDLAEVRLKSAHDNADRIDSQFRTEKARADETVRQSQAALIRARVNAFQDKSKRAEYVQAQADLEKARAALLDPEILDHQRDQSKASVDQLAAVLGDSQRQLRETTVRAPLTGIVTKKMLQVGELATGLSSFSAGTPIVRIEDRRNMRVKLNVNEIDTAKMKVGMQANIDVDAIPSHPYSGIIRRIAPASVEAPSGSTTTDAVVKYEVEIQVTDADSRLRSGMSAKCTIDVIRHTNTLVLPVEYVTREGRDAYVQLNSVKKGEKPSRKKIEIGAESGSKIEILGGLKDGDVVYRPAFNGPERKGMMQGGPDNN